MGSYIVLFLFDFDQELEQKNWLGSTIIVMFWPPTLWGPPASTAKCMVTWQVVAEISGHTPNVRNTWMTSGEKEIAVKVLYNIT